MGFTDNKEGISQTISASFVHRIENLIYLLKKSEIDLLVFTFNIPFWERIKGYFTQQSFQGSLRALKHIEG